MSSFRDYHQELLNTKKNVKYENVYQLQADKFEIYWKDDYLWNIILENKGELNFKKHSNQYNYTFKLDYPVEYEIEKNWKKLYEDESNEELGLFAIEFESIADVWKWDKIEYLLVFLIRKINMNIDIIGDFRSDLVTLKINF